MRTLSLFLLFGVLFFSCSPSTSNQEGGESETTTEQEEAKEMKYTLTPFSESQTFPDAKIESMEYKNGTFTFGIDGDSYQLGVQTPDAAQKMCANSGKGQHIHLIVDNAPYSAQYTNSFDYEIEDGEHYLLAFLSRSYHESIKTTDASVIYKIATENKGITNVENVSGPMLFYSRPKGTYVGAKDTKKVMLDFYLANASLGSDYKVKADINGEEHILDKWMPYYIEGLPMGENKVTLTLIDANGNAVATPLNPVSRTFTLKEDPAEG